jgi:hypothetical protein
MSKNIIFEENKISKPHSFVDVSVVMNVIFRWMLRRCVGARLDSTGSVCRDL